MAPTAPPNTSPTIRPSALSLIDRMNDLAYRVNVVLPQWCPERPHPKQVDFLLSPETEVLFGGAAGGGKSSALLQRALLFVDRPDYAAILFRKTYADLALPGALMGRADDWLGPTAARWHRETRTWTFPSGATITFGYSDHEGAEKRYQSAEFQFIGADEVTDFSETFWRFMFSRLRRKKGSDVPLAMRCSSNPWPGWVKQRFIIERALDRVFIPSRLEDNPSLDREEYLSSLSHLDPVTRARLEAGDWDVMPDGNMFKRDWFRIIDRAPEGLVSPVRYWDLAATAPTKKGQDPDWTAGALMGMKTRLEVVSPDRGGGLGPKTKRIADFYLLDVRRGRETPEGVNRLIERTANQDGRSTAIWIEEQPGAAGKMVSKMFSRLLSGYSYRPDRPTGSKEVRAAPFSSQCEAGNVYIVNGPWVSDFLEEACSFPLGPHDDQIDAASGAFGRLSARLGESQTIKRSDLGI